VLSGAGPELRKGSRVEGAGEECNPRKKNPKKHGGGGWRQKTARRPHHDKFQRKKLERTLHSSGAYDGNRAVVPGNPPLVLFMAEIGENVIP